MGNSSTTVCADITDATAVTSNTSISSNETAVTSNTSISSNETTVNLTDLDFLFPNEDHVEALGTDHLT